LQQLQQMQQQLHLQPSQPGSQPPKEFEEVGAGSFQEGMTGNFVQPGWSGALLQNPSAVAGAAQDKLSSLAAEQEALTRAPQMGRLNRQAQRLRQQQLSEPQAQQLQQLQQWQMQRQQQREMPSYPTAWQPTMANTQEAMEAQPGNILGLSEPNLQAQANLQNFAFVPRDGNPQVQQLQLQQQEATPSIPSLQRPSFLQPSVQQAQVEDLSLPPMQQQQQQQQQQSQQQQQQTWQYQLQQQ